MGGLGSVSLSMTNSAPNWPLSIHVHSTDPVSCLGSQYAGWSLSFVQNDDNFSALGSGPCESSGKVKRKYLRILDMKISFFLLLLFLEIDQTLLKK